VGPIHKNIEVVVSNITMTKKFKNKESVGKEKNDK
jgi:hypothetical protein